MSPLRRRPFRTAGNGGTKPTQAAFTIFYNQGTQRYDLEQTLQPDEQMWMDVGQLIRERVPDKNGKTLPADLTTGSYEFRDLTNKGVGTLFEGKVIYDKTYGHVAYGCAACCGWDQPRFWYDPLGVLIQAQQDQGVNALNTCDGGDLEDVSDSFYSNWSTGSTQIATVDAYGTHTGVGVGSTTSFTSGDLNNNSQIRKCPIVVFNPSGNDKVTPSILLGGCSGTNITNTTQSVVVGQQIVLCASYTLPSGSSVQSQSWTIPGTGSNPPTAISNFTYAVDYSSGGPVLLSSSQLSQQSVTFYFVGAGSSLQVQFTLTLNDESQHSATATFNVSAPTSAGISVSPLGQLQFVNNGTTNALIEFGSPLGTAGIQLTGQGSAPPNDSGAYVWGQLISNNSYSYTIGASKTSCNGPTGLDNQFPIVTGFSFSDSPVRGLPSADNEFTWTWSATSYFMWNPQLTNSIPVPLGYVSWQFFGDAVQNTTTNVWSLQSDSSSSASSFQASLSYPSWSSVAKNGQNPCP